MRRWVAGAFSAEVGTGSAQENATKQKTRARIRSGRIGQRSRCAIATVLFSLVGTAVIEAQERGTKVVPGRPARVFVLAGFDEACKSLKGVAIEITKAPAKGQVQLREDQDTTIMSSASGKCIGTRQKGTGIYYLAAQGAVGTDTFSISARIGTNPPVTRTFTVAIATD
ncbi:MAG: hypothetical protein RL291_313 [Pseudomonadota bacterium]